MVWLRPLQLYSASQRPMDHASPNFAQSLIAGGAAGMAVDILFFPIDTVKTRLQAAQGFVRAGGFRGVYRGVGSVVIGSAPGAAVFFAVYDTLKQHSPLPTTTTPTTPNLSPLTHVISASVAEIAACVIRVPTEVIKTRSQTSTSGSGRGALPSLAVARQTLETDGLRGFYRGFGITIAREIPFTSIQFPLYEFLKVQLTRYLNRKPLYAHEAAVCGSIAGAVAAATTTPLDVLKTRVMLDMRNGAASSNFVTHFMEIRRKEGIKVLFAGAVPRTLWISAGGAVFLGVYEWVVHGLMRY